MTQFPQTTHVEGCANDDVGNSEATTKVKEVSYNLKPPHGKTYAIEEYKKLLNEVTKEKEAKKTRKLAKSRDIDFQLEVKMKLRSDVKSSSQSK